MDEDRKITKEELKQYIRDHIPGLKASLHDGMGVMHYIAHYFLAELSDVDTDDLDEEYDELTDYFLYEDCNFYKYNQKKRLEVELELIDRFEKYANS